MEERITRWSFYNSKQIYLFMVWQEDWYEGEVIFGRVLFTFIDVFAIKAWHEKYLKWANSPYKFGSRS